MTQPSRPRRSDRTREAILNAARERFASDGYDRATIRAIASDAAIDPSMVMRYFGSKDRLFAAAARFDLHLPDLAAVAPGERGAALARHFIWRWEGSPTDNPLPVLLRSALTNEMAAQRMRSIFAGQVVTAVAAASGRADAAERAGLVASQMLGLAVCRYVLRLPAIAELDPERLVAWVGPTIQRYLEGSEPGELKPGAGRTPGAAWPPWAPPPPGSTSAPGSGGSTPGGRPRRGRRR